MNKFLLCSLLAISSPGVSQNLQLDPTFGTNGRFTYTTTELVETNNPNGVFKTVMDDQQNLYAVARPGNAYIPLVVKVNSIGKSLPAFGSSGAFNSGNYLSTGIVLKENIVYVSGFTAFKNIALSEISTGGILSKTAVYSSLSNVGIYTSAAAPEGKLYVAGSTNIAANTSSSFGIVRIKEDGSLDSTFGTNGVFSFVNSTMPTRVLHDMAVLDDGKLLVTGHDFKSVIIARILPNGTLDKTFGENGYRTISLSSTQTYGYTLKIKEKLVYVSGGYYTPNGDGNLFVARFSLEGNPDLSFGTDGVATFGTTNNEAAGWYNLDVQPNGFILVSGNDRSNIFTTFLARLQPNGKPDRSFNAGSYYKLGERGAYHTVHALSDSTFLATGYTDVNGYFALAVDKYTVSKGVITGNEKDKEEMTEESISVAYAKGMLIINSEKQIIEAIITDVHGNSKNFGRAFHIPLKENQVYILKIRTADNMMIKKIATY